MRYLSRLAVGAGCVTAITQIPTPTPSPAIFAAGVLVALFGGIAICDEGVTS